MTTENIYSGFDGWADVIRQFHDFGYEGDRDSREAACLATNPEPEQVLLAEYYTGNYEGDALVVYRNGDDFYVNEGSHCSCMGLENQWEPEHYDRATFIEMVKRKLANYRKDWSGSGADTKANWEKILIAAEAS